MAIHNLTLKKLCVQRQFKESVTVCKKHPLLSQPVAEVLWLVACLLAHQF